MPVPRRFDRRPPERDTTRINERIRVPEVRLIGADGEQIGIVSTRRRARDARRRPTSTWSRSPPRREAAGLPGCSTTRSTSTSRSRSAKAARKHQQQVNVREIKLRPKIADHDYETKKGHVERFLRGGDKVKVTIMFRGREQAYPERGRALLQRLFDDLGEIAVVEQEPLQEGRNMHMLVAPTRAAGAPAAE